MESDRVERMAAPASVVGPAPAPTMPARWVPLLYFAFAHVCLAAAFAALAFDPRSLAGFFYHPRMLRLKVLGDDDEGAGRGHGAGEEVA